MRTSSVLGKKCQYPQIPSFSDHFSFLCSWQILLMQIPSVVGWEQEDFQISESTHVFYMYFYGWNETHFGELPFL